METPAADPLVGRTIGQYEVLAKLGGGGMGVVYTARDSRLGRLVALKFLPAQWSHDETAKQRFIREAQAASATDHRNICTIHDIGAADDGQLFIVMAHYAGETLKQRLERGPLSIDEAIDIAAQIAEGLAKAHAQGVVHRDVKPGNLILTEDGVKILDFGLAKLADSAQLTIAGSTLGTVAYMSPEQARAEEADARSDIWSTGIVLYEMLAGSVPFKGGYAEAILHAIRTVEPPPLVRTDGDIPPPLASILTRALQKDPAERYQSARELARDLRLLQGRTLPIELRTEYVSAAAAQAARSQRRRRWRTPTVAAAVALVVLTLGTPLWVFAPVERLPIAIVPVSNQTGFAELEPYRLALTEELTAILDGSPVSRVVPYGRLLQILRPFRLAKEDVASRAVVGAVAAQSGARVLVVPTLVYDGGAWRMRVEFRDVATATNVAPSIETAPVVSSLAKDTVYSLMTTVAEQVDTALLPLVPFRVSVARTVRRWTRAVSSPDRRFKTLDAASLFEQGLDAYEQMEYSAAATAFAGAAAIDARNPVLSAWRARVARVMRRDDQTRQLADEAAAAATGELAADDRMFVDAVVAESRSDAGNAERRYRELAERFADDPWTALELAAFLDRQGRTEDAISAYVETLRRDPSLPRPDVELCRMYNRASEFMKAREHAERAIERYRKTRTRAGEAQALLCLADALRTGTDEQRQQATRHATAALDIFREERLEYNVPRAYNYLATLAGLRNDRAAAANYGEQALAAARRVGNQTLEALVSMNLGATYTYLDRGRAVDNYQQSYRLYESLGDQSRAAEVQANRGALLIVYGSNPDEGLREVQNALAVSRRLGNKDFEAFCLQLIAMYEQRVGRFAEADRALNQTLAIGRERDLSDKVLSATRNLARSRFALADYEKARELLNSVIAAAADAGTRIEAVIQLGRIDIRMGDFAAAQRSLEGVSEEGARDAGLAPLLYLARGELQYESGRLPAASTEFTKAATAAAGDFADPAAIESQAYLGLIEASSGNIPSGRRTLENALARASRHFTVEARCRLFLARVDVLSRELEGALRTLNEIDEDDDTHTIGPELRAQVHYWKAMAMVDGDRTAADAEQRAARTILTRVIDAMPPAYRKSIASRPDIAKIVG